VSKEFAVPRDSHDSNSEHSEKRGSNGTVSRASAVRIFLKRRAENL